VYSGDGTTLTVAVSLSMILCNFSSAFHFGIPVLGPRRTSL
jgi:hypothetical protein